MGNNRRRGHQFERDVVNQFKRVFPDAKRKLEYQKDACTGVDIENTGQLKIQCKKAKASVPINKIEEIKEPGTPCLVSKTDRKPAYITLPLWDFLRLLEDVGTVFEE